MLRNASWFFIVVFLALLQTTWPDVLKFQNVLPNLTLIAVVYFAVADGQERAMYTAALGGIYQDVASNNVLGHHILCLVIIAYAVGRFATRLVTEHPAVRVGLVFCAGMLEGLLYASIVYIQNPNIGFTYTVATSVMPSVFYTALIAPIVFLVLQRIFQRPELTPGGVN
jgi:rod shape-determining protein MreD